MAEIGSQIAILAGLLGLSGFFSGAEVALISLSDAKIEEMIKHKQIGAKQIKKLKENPQRMLSAILIGNNVVNIGAASYMTVVMIGLFGDYAVGIATGLMTLLILIFGEITPKSLAAQKNVRFSQFAGPPIWWFSVVFRPVIAIIDWFITVVLRSIGVKGGQTQVTEDEIRYMVTAAEQEGTIEESEKSMIHNVFELDETTVGEIITPKADMVAIASDANVGKALQLIAKRKYSRIPVYEGQKDNIVGVLNLRDLIARKNTTKVKTVMTPPYVVPENKRVSDIISRFQRRKEHFAIVVDEHGTVMGLVTLEDAIEEIVGEIVDESETVVPNIQKRGKTWLVRGRTEIQEANTKMKLQIPDGDYDTISGFLLERMGHIPSEGEEMKYKRAVFTVEELKGHRIRSVTVRKT